MNPHILLVEDDPAIRTLLCSTLEMHDYHVSEAENRVAALAQLRADPGIGVVILDLGLPPHAHDLREGIAVLQAIEAETMTVKVIVLSGQDQQAASREAVREGAFDFLTKPASVETILGAVRRAMLYLQKECELGAEGIKRIAVNAQVGEGLKGIRSDAEERLVREVLKETGFNVYQSAKRLGVKRENIYYFLKKFHITRED